jgi:hypothetical protein
MLHGDLFPEFGCDGELIDLPEQFAQALTLKTLRGVLDRA